MNIQDALKETGEARRPNTRKGQYAYLNKDVLFWNDGPIEAPVLMVSIFADDWQPYHEVKEIRPEKAGELWENKESNLKFYVHEWGVRLDKRDLHILWNNGPRELLSNIDIIHNKNGWIRCFPHVEDENVERIEIEVYSDCIKSGDAINTVDIHLVFARVEDKKMLCKQRHVKMYIEIPKDKP